MEDLKEKRGHWKLDEETLDRTLSELALEDAMHLLQERFPIE